MALQKNQLVELTVTGVTGEGNGVARYIDDTCPAPGFVVFIPGTAIGDRLVCRIVKVQKNHAFGKIEELLEPSPDRLPGSDCPAFGRCGGCNWRHITYEAECRYKQNWVQETMRRVGDIDAPVLPLMGGDSPDRYRNKAQFPVAKNEKGKPVFGFYRTRSHEVAAVDSCAIQDERANALARAVCGWMTETGARPYEETTGAGLVRHIFVRTAETGSQLCLVCTGAKLPQPGRLVALAREAAPDLRGVVVNINAKSTNVILGAENRTLWGEERLTDTLCGRSFSLSPHSFYQVNHA